MFLPLEPAHFPSAILAEFYRFALLLTGDPSAAEQLLAATLDGADAQLGQLRSELSRHVWVISRIRQQCLQAAAPQASGREASRLPRKEGALEKPPDALTPEAQLLVQRVCSLPEPERSAIALLHLNLFTVEEIAKVLEVSQDVLGGMLARGRNLVGDLFRAAPPAESPTP